MELLQRLLVLLLQELDVPLQGRDAGVRAAPAGRDLRVPPHSRQRLQLVRGHSPWREGLPEAPDSGPVWQVANRGQVVTRHCFGLRR